MDVERGVQEGDGFDVEAWEEDMRYAATPATSSAETTENVMILRLGDARQKLNMEVLVGEGSVAEGIGTEATAG